MDRWVSWAVSALVAMGAFALARLAGAPSGLDLVIAFGGAIAGTVIGQMLMQRLRGPESAPPPPPGRGSGKRGG